MDNSSPINIQPQLPLKRAILWIFVSIVVIVGLSGIGILLFKQYQHHLKFNPAYNIVAIVQTNPDAEGIRSAYFAELLNLSVDRPTNIFIFNSKEAQQKLLASPVIKEATVKKIRPGTIYIDYALRKPIAFLGDYQNAVIDADGVVFPLKPFFTPKKLPEIALGGDEIKSKFVWGKTIEGKRIDLAFELLNIMSKQCCDEQEVLNTIDVSNAFASSYGERQIVITVEERVQKVVDNQIISMVFPRILRLMPDNYQEQLANYLILRNYLRKKEKLLMVGEAKPIVIDLRLSELAFIGMRE